MKKCVNFLENVDYLGDSIFLCICDGVLLAAAV